MIKIHGEMICQSGHFWPYFTVAPIVHWMLSNVRCCAPSSASSRDKKEDEPIAWVVLVQVAPCDWNRLDSCLFYHFGQFCLLGWVWKISRKRCPFFGKGKRRTKSILAITFDWKVLGPQTSGQRLWATFFMLFSGITHLAMFNIPSQIAK